MKAQAGLLWRVGPVFVTIESAFGLRQCLWSQRVASELLQGESVPCREVPCIHQTGCQAGHWASSTWRGVAWR